MDGMTLSAPVDDAGVLRRAENWRRAGRDVALATVVETFGSAPRPVGSHLVVDEAGAFFGSVSAGCVEGEVIMAAQDAIADGAPRFLEFGVADDAVWRSGLSCGGRIAVLVERIDAARLAVLSEVNAAIAARLPCATITPLDGGATLLMRAHELAMEGWSRTISREGRRFFVNHYQPGPHLLVVGAAHVAQALAPMAALAGFDVTIIDPREAYASAERFPQARLDTRWPDEALPAIGLDASTAVAVLTHDPKIDDPALRLALASDCFYVGALGSRATNARRAERLKALGVAPLALERLRAPIGLDIAAVSPAEIAVSILAELVLVRGQKPLRPLSATSSASCGLGA